jgi:hypothetical protein
MCTYIYYDHALKVDAFDTVGNRLVSSRYAVSNLLFSKYFLGEGRRDDYHRSSSINTIAILIVS